MDVTVTAELVRAGAESALAEIAENGEPYEREFASTLTVEVAEARGRDGRRKPWVVFRDRSGQRWGWFGWKVYPLERDDWFFMLYLELRRALSAGQWSRPDKRGIRWTEV